MVTLKINKGYDLITAGEPISELYTLLSPETVAVKPEKIPFIKPKLLIDKGDRVKIGTPLYFDKKNSFLKFLSPGSGKISEILYGPRRSISEIIVKLDSSESYIDFEKIDYKKIKTLDRKTVVNLLIEGGLWPFIRELPFRNIADPEFSPPHIIVTIGQADLFEPSGDVYLKENGSLFRYGLSIIAGLSKHIYVCSDLKASGLSEECKSLVTHQISGKYPSLDAGVINYHIKRNESENRCWYINGQDLLMIAKLFKTGRYPVERIIRAGGDHMKKPGYYKTRIGAPVSYITGETDDLNYVSCFAGGVLAGYQVPMLSHIGLYETSLFLIAAGNEDEFFGFIKPGFSRPSYTKTFASVFNKKNIKMDSGLHGEERACINCGFCTQVCPVNILPQFTYKSVLADEIDEALSHGLLDCVECGLCSYVCPSKIELTKTLKQARHDYYLETR